MTVIDLSGNDNIIEDDVLGFGFSSMKTKMRSLIRAKRIRAVKRRLAVSCPKSRRRRRRFW